MQPGKENWGVGEGENQRERKRWIYTHTQRRIEKGKARENHSLVPDVATLEEEVCTVPNANVCAGLRLRTPAYATLPFSIKEGILGCFLECSNVGSWANKQTFSSGRQWPNLGKNSGFPTAV